MSKTILLTKNQKVIVDDLDYLKLSKYRWHVHNKGYAVTYVNNKLEYMHRIVMNLRRGDGKIVDHINGNPQDNRRENLRLVTKQQNSFNRAKRAKTISRFKGVTKCKGNDKWQVFCSSKYLGSFDTEEEAAKVYQDYADELFGEYAKNVNSTKKGK